MRVETTVEFVACLKGASSCRNIEPRFKRNMGSLDWNNNKENGEDDDDDGLVIIADDAVLFRNQILPQNPASAATINNCDDYGIDFLKNNSYTTKQLGVLIQIWVGRHREISKKIKDETKFLDPYLNLKLNEIDTDQIERALALNYDRLDEVLVDLEEERADSAGNSETREDDSSAFILTECNLCKLQEQAKIAIRNCASQMYNSGQKLIECPIAAIGLSCLALREMKSAVEKMHKERCLCSHCMQAVNNYDYFVCEVGLHEGLHKLYLN